MKRNLVIAALAFVLSGATLSATAQTRPGPTPTPVPRPVAPQPATNTVVPAAKIAVVDTTNFGDEKTGIKRYISAVKSVDASFQARSNELVGLQTRLKGIADEIAKLRNTPVVAEQTIQAKQSDGEALQRDLKYKQEQFDADYKKKYEEVVMPISRDIGNALSEYGNRNGLTMIFDISKLAPAVLALSPATDVTAAFIADYNSRHP
jgi:Skp family chaperone for outer membrane proteins